MSERRKLREDCVQCGGFGCNWCLEPTTPAASLIYDRWAQHEHTKVLMEQVKDLSAKLAEHSQKAAASEPVDRSDAVNLAMNMLDVHDCKGITPNGVKILCHAIMKMDKALTKVANALFGGIEINVPDLHLAAPRAPDITPAASEPVCHRQPHPEDASRQFHEWAIDEHEKQTADSEPVAWINEDQTIGPNYGKKYYSDAPYYSLNPLTYKHTPLFAAPPDVTKVLREAREALNELIPDVHDWYGAKVHRANQVLASINAVLGDKQ